MVLPIDIYLASQSTILFTVDTDFIFKFRSSIYIRKKKKNRKFIFIEIPEIYIQDNDLGIFRSNFDIRN